MQKVRQKFAYVKNLPYLCTQNWRIMKMYKKPITEIAAVDTERLMDSMTMSAGPGGGGKTEAPARQSVAPAVPGDGL